MVQYSFEGLYLGRNGSVPEGGKEHVDVIPLIPWSWSQPHILEQLRPKPISSNVPDDPPAEPQFAVTPTEYFTAFKAGQLMKLNIPIAKTSFI